ncbi:MAG: hypothetical protein ACJAZ0_002246 [Halioglobus sp.]|jgi:hypothetical protein
MLHFSFASIIELIVMRRAGLALFLIAAIATPALLLKNQAVTLWLLKSGLAAFSSQRLELVEPQIDLYRGHISAKQVHLYPSDGPPLLTILELDANISIRGLLRGDLAQSVFRAKSVQVYVSENDDSADPNPIQWMSYANWLPHELIVEQFHLLSAARNLWIFPLKNVSGKRLDPADFRMSAQADYGGEPLELLVDLLGVTRQSEFRILKLNSKILAPKSDSEIILQGEVRASPDKLSYDMQLSAHYKDVGAFLGAIDGAIKLQGKLEVNGDLQGNTESFELTNAHFLLDNMPAYGFEAGGTLAVHRTQKSELRLVAAGEMASLEPLIDWLDIDLTPLGTAQAHVTVAGELGELMVENFILATNSEDGLKVSLSGHFELGEKPFMGKLRDDQVLIDLHGSSLAVLKRWIGDIPYDPGPWQASGLLSRSEDSAQVNDIIIELGEIDGMHLRAEGRVGELFGLVTEGLSAVNDIDLLVEYRVPDSAKLTAIVGSETPAYHEVIGQVRLTGSPTQLKLSEGNANVIGSDLDAMLSNISAVVTTKANTQFTDTYADLNLKLSDTSALSQYVNQPMLSLGELTLSGSVQQSGRSFGLDNLKATISGDTVSLTSQGAIDNLSTLEGTVLQTQFAGMSTLDLLTTYMDSFVYPKELGDLAGSFVISRAASEWQLRDLSFANQNNPFLQLDVTGSILDLAGLPEATLSVDFNFRDEALLEALTSLKIKPTNGDIELEVESRRMNLEGHIQFGDSLFTGQGELEHEENEIRSLKVSLESANVLLSDLGLQADETAYNPSDKFDGVSPTQGLEQRLQRSPEYLTDFKLKIDNLSGETSNLQDINIHITGEQKRYTLRRFSALYGDAPAEIRGIIDLNASPPFVSLAGEALSVPLYLLTGDLGIDTNIEGLISVSGGISTQGLSGKELLRKSNGSVAIALEDMVIEGAAYDVLATDFLAWIYSGAVLESSTEISCSMAKFSVKNGVARTDSIFIESRRMIATGKGKLDLPTKKIDITLTPRSKAHRVSIPSSVTLKGDLSNPKSVVSPVSATAKASTDLLLLVPRFAMKIFGLKTDDARDVTPCVAEA